MNPKRVHIGIIEKITTFLKVYSLFKCFNDSFLLKELYWLNVYGKGMNPIILPPAMGK